MELGRVEGGLVEGRGRRVSAFLTWKYSFLGLERFGGLILNGLSSFCLRLEWYLKGERGGRGRRQ